MLYRPGSGHRLGFRDSAAVMRARNDIIATANVNNTPITHARLFILFKENRE